MKLIIASIWLALFALSTSATTLSPVQLINPIGSTAGMAVVSTGASTPPAWGNVSISTLTGILPISQGGTGQATQASAFTALIGASLVPVANGGTGVATAAAELSRIGAASTAGTLAQFGATTSAQLAGVISDETGTGSLVLGTSPTITTPNIVGVSNASNAATGSVRETLSTNVAVGSAVVLTTNVTANITSVPLSAGDWDVWGSACTSPGGSAVQNLMVVGISANSASLPVAPGGGAIAQLPFTTPAGGAVCVPVGYVRFNVSAATTAFLVILAQFSSTNAAYGFISARRR